MYERGYFYNAILLTRDIFRAWINCWKIKLLEKICIYRGKRTGVALYVATDTHPVYGVSCL